MATAFAVTPFGSSKLSAGGFVSVSAMCVSGGVSVADDDLFFSVGVEGGVNTGDGAGAIVETVDDLFFSVLPPITGELVSRFVSFFSIAVIAAATIDGLLACSIVVGGCSVVTFVVRGVVTADSLAVSLFWGASGGTVSSLSAGGCLSSTITVGGAARVIADGAAFKNFGVGSTMWSEECALSCFGCTLLVLTESKEPAFGLLGGDAARDSLIPEDK